MAGNSHTFEIHGLKELQDDFQKVYNRYPQETEKFMRKEGTGWIHAVIEKMPEKWKKGKLAPAKASSWSRDLTRNGYGLASEVEIWSKSPHWHLLENGHEVKADPHMFAAYKSGKIDRTKKGSGSKKRSSNVKRLGWAPGFGFGQRTRDEFQNGRFSDDVRGFLDEMIKKYKL